MNFRRFIFSSATSLSALFLFAAALPASATTYTIDREHSSVGFRVKHLVSKVTGHFTQFSGTIEYDPKNVAKSKATIEIDTASIDTGNKKRDEHLRSPDFFDAAKYPKIKFETKEVTNATAQGAKLKGTLTMHGVTKEIPAEVEFGGETSFMGTPKAGFTAKSTLNRKDYGILWNKSLDTGGFVLGEDVEITIEVEATGPAAPAPAKKK
jgi:polyisoprenoid-binding protein YceI